MSNEWEIDLLPRCGLVLVVGPMFAGKTTALLECLARAEQKGLRVLALKPSTDVSVRGGAIGSHRGQTAPCHLIPPGEVTEIRDLLVREDPQAIFVDEGQFFAPETVEVLLEASVTRLVLIAGLVEDFLGQDFGPLPAIIRAGRATQVRRLTATCASCRAPASHSQRLVASRDQVLVGGADQYEPRCDGCWDPS